MFREEDVLQKRLYKDKIYFFINICVTTSLVIISFCISIKIAQNILQIADVSGCIYNYMQWLETIKVEYCTIEDAQLLVLECIPGH